MLIGGLSLKLTVLTPIARHQCSCVAKKIDMAVMYYWPASVLLMLLYRDIGLLHEHRKEMLPAAKITCVMAHAEQ